ncbi:hypothetical protein [Flavobacterium sedimenticola]|uniref:Uncharacterized protein n=1 Tax=Flavobacterium sedimenticola TaxID=3043286 RepID=A0ABT6XN59_9FLAO|nr:hypothetical protein [Flavobacterium sedimenticola]MDI9256527.1 hypothetical protein [Flavobacterium sedimenticola]
MGKLSDKEQEVLDFLLDFVNMEIFSIEQQERDLGRLDYSLCSDDAEKQTITTKKVQKFKKRLSKCNPIIAGYLNALTTPDPLNTEFEELREIITKNFLFTEYYELFEELVNSDIKDLERYQFESVIENLGYDYKPLKDFVQGVCDVNSYFTYKSFLDIPNDSELNYDKVVKKLNDAFFKLEAFMSGTINDYKHFDFNTAFTELFYFTRKSENYNYENCKRVGQYWGLTEQIRVDYDKTNFENVKAYNNKAFCHDCDVITSIAWDRIEEFNSFQTPDEVEEQTRKKSISDLMKPTTKSSEVVKVESKETESKIPSQENPYPRIFTSVGAYIKFKNLLDEFGTGNENLANYSFVYHRMKKDKLIFDDYQQIQFVYFLLEFDINISRIKPKSQLGNNDLREGIYNRI